MTLSAAIATAPPKTRTSERPPDLNAADGFGDHEKQ